MDGTVLDWLSELNVDWLDATLGFISGSFFGQFILRNAWD
jgi:hypothetical protein